MALQKVSLGFHNIEYSVKVGKGEPKPILRNVSGLVNPSEMLCILGPSGSGKTSLIHIVSKKIASDAVKSVSGQVLCNGEEFTASEMMRISGFVSQEDVFNAELTVSETLKFAAELKLKRQDRASRTDAVVKQLQLENCTKTYIGDDSNPYLKGISGGEKRRLAIAMEILDPNISVLVLDEPTSGLDAAAALNVCNVLRSLADGGITVATSLHQPRNSIMSLFDKLMILAGGRRIFFGGLQQYVPAMESELKIQIPQHESPYDLMLDLLNPAIERQNVKVDLELKDGTTLADALADMYDQSEVRAKVDAAAPTHTGGLDKSQLKTGRGSTNWFGKFWSLLRRTFVIKLRDPMVAMTQLSTGIFMGVIFGGLYWDTYDKEQVEYAILDTQMCITMTIVMMVWLPFDVTLTFPKERKVFLRERKAGLYPTTAFFMARILVDMPMHALAATLLAVIVYFMAGLTMGVGNFILLSVLGVLVGAAMMQSIGAMCRTFEEANLLMMPVFMLAMMTSTSFVRQVPGFLLWMRDISVMGLLADMAMYLEFRDMESEYGTPDEVLNDFAVQIRSDGEVTKAAAILLAILGVCRVLTFVAVKFFHTGRSSCRENLAD